MNYTACTRKEQGAQLVGRPARRGRCRAGAGTQHAPHMNSLQPGSSSLPCSPLHPPPATRSRKQRDGTEMETPGWSRGGCSGAAGRGGRAGAFLRWLELEAGESSRPVQLSSSKELQPASRWTTRYTSSTDALPVPVLQPASPAGGRGGNGAGRGQSPVA